MMVVQVACQAQCKMLWRSEGTLDPLSSDVLTWQRPATYVATDGSCATAVMDERTSEDLPGADGSGAMAWRPWMYASPLTGAAWQKVCEVD